MNEHDYLKYARFISSNELNRTLFPSLFLFVNGIAPTPEEVDKFNEAFLGLRDYESSYELSSYEDVYEEESTGSY